MNTLPWTPWHHVVALRDDLRSGALSLASFAADLYEVAMQKGQRPLYEDPAQFFALTYPTYNLRELAKDVVQRLAGKNQKAVRQLELTYGGGKTHTLITLYHLVNDPAHLPTLPAVQEFIQHIGMTPPQSRVALLPFDKLDVEKGMEVRAPNGDAPNGGVRWLKQPWSVLAYQIAGDDGLRLLHAEGEAAERDTAPAENLLVELMRIPEREGLSILILIDEVLMYAREKVGQDPVWRSRLINFFQYLTQAVTKVDHCALVASLLATDPRKSDTLGKELTQELYAIFRREREEGVQPVLKEDVAEVLRRRFFTPDSVRDREAFRPHVVAALKGITALDEQTAQEGKSAEARFLQSYPFHPDLTEIFYTKWTNLEGFQRTRGVLRTFALALRDAEPWDTAPLIGANVFLSAPLTTNDTDFTDKKEKSVQSVKSVVLSEAARELTGIAATEEYEGKRQDWSAILLGELEKAQEIQQQYPGLAHREVEQAVFATFLHSQPVGQKARTRDLFLLLGQTRPDKIELEKALHRWVERSWFLDEETAQESGEEDALPRAWRLGSRPNLTQMHHDACENRVSPELVDATLIEAIDKLNSLTAGAKGAGARVHVMPKAPRDVDDDGEFHYAILGPEAACDPGQPSDLARRILTETTTPEKPRVNKNAVVLVTPSVGGLEQVRQAVLNELGWQEVQSQLKKQHDLDKIDPLRWQLLLIKLKGAQQAIPAMIRQAYTTVIAWSARGEIEA
ncbi:MAG: ATP-binding protein, partial [Anaerolineae bacterium]|nr:ATP-binding protein [Anaerolineae bacterium]